MEMFNKPTLLKSVLALNTTTKPILQTLPDIQNGNLASEFYKRLVEYITQFEEGLTSTEDVAVKLVSYGETVTIHVTSIGYYNPSLISFVGTLASGEKVQLIQHISQISFLLIATKIAKPIEDRERIGFKLKHQQDKESAK